MNENPPINSSQRPFNRTQPTNWLPPPVRSWKVYRDSSGVLKGVSAVSIDLDFPSPMAELIAIVEDL